MATPRYDIREVTTYIRDAMQFKQDAETGRLPGRTVPLQEDLAVRIANGLIPQLRQIYLDMAATQIEWQERRFQATLAAAQESGDLVAGYSPATWQAWGIFMLKLQDWLATPIQELDGATPIDALLDRYIPEEAAPRTTNIPVALTP